MGAVTALLHADRDPSIAGLVLDSPFTSMTKLAEELYTKVMGGSPGIMYSMAQWLVRKSVRSRANFEFEDLTPIDHVAQAFIPALFVIANQDDFINPKHGVELYEKYAGDKNLIKVDGGHNDLRPSHAITSIYIFFFNTLQVAKLVPGIAAQVEESVMSKYEPQHKIPASVAKGSLAGVEDQDDEMETIMKLSLETAQKEEEERKKKVGAAPPVPPLPKPHVANPIPNPAPNPSVQKAPGIKDPQAPPVPKKK